MKITKEEKSAKYRKQTETGMEQTSAIQTTTTRSTATRPTESSKKTFNLTNDNKRRRRKTRKRRNVHGTKSKKSVSKRPEKGVWERIKKAKVFRKRN
ncbi:hypothetical protein MHBO_002932 [Bonamia ostreae]|uniref:Uncharacterized protein n=1 Tax=Bonamia ostreae TaxID=126728 RepID=A0ABV2APM1_9EUKA